MRWIRHSRLFGAEDGPARYIAVMPLPRQQFNPSLTPWHITFGTYGTRLHGAKAPTVDKQHNQRPDPFLRRSAAREQSGRDRMKFPPRYLTIDQRLFVEIDLPAICKRGG